MAENRNIIPLIKNVTEATDAEDLAMEAARELIKDEIKLFIGTENEPPKEAFLTSPLASSPCHPRARFCEYCILPMHL